MAASPSSVDDDRRRRRSRSRSRSPSRRDRGDDDDHERNKSSSRRGRKRSDDEDSDDDVGSRDRHRSSRKHKRASRKKSKSSSSRHRDRKRSKKKRRRHHRDYSSSSDDSSSDSSSDSDSSSSPSSSSRHRSKRRKKSRKRSSKKSTTADKQTTNNHVQMNEKLISKLSQRNETLEEREERRAKRRAARITARFGYTADDNPFRDPNLHEMFTWKKKEEQQPASKTGVDNEDETNKDKNYYGNNDEDNNGGGKHPKSRRDKQEQIFSEIEKVRNRRRERELHLEEMERIRAEESKMKELEHYDEWARKEEAFHLQQQRQRSAIRLVEGREKAVDVLAQNILLFGARNEDEENAARVKYKEKYSALEELESLEVNLEEPHSLLKDLKLSELEELLVDIDAYRKLEREAVSESGSDDNMAIHYWDALHKVTIDEIQYLKTGGEKGNHASMVTDIRDMFKGQSMAALVQMKHDIEQKLRGGVIGDANGVVDTDYWQKVLHQLDVHLAKMELSEIHSKMLVKQLEKLEVKREELRKKAESGETVDDRKAPPKELSSAEMAAPLPDGVEAGFGNLEEELGLEDEVDLNNGNANPQYAMQDKFRPRKPRYFNRVKTGYDWNAYNKTHYDHDNPPPKIVQGYKFNVFYPDLIDRTKTPQYFLEKADTDDFCILRFSAGPPYEDVAFKIINRQWNKSRKRGFRCTFERGVLSLYFNFATHWYRR